MPEDPFALITTVELTWIEKQVERWLRFGRPVSDTILDRQRRMLSFAPGSVFAFVRWAANEYGTVESHIDIVRTVGSGEDYQTVPCVRPGAEVLLHQNSWPRVQRVMEAIDVVEALDIDLDRGQSRLLVSTSPSAGGPAAARCLYQSTASGMAASSRVALSALSASGLPTLARAFPFSFRPACPSSCRVRFVPGQRDASRRERKVPAAPPRVFFSPSDVFGHRFY